MSRVLALVLVAGLAGASPVRLDVAQRVVAQSVTAAAVCGAPSTLPRLPTVSGWGDSIMFGVCSGGPLNALDALLPGGTTQGWWMSNRAVSGENAAQIRARYIAEELTSCYGIRCGVLWLEGGVNCLRGGTAAATCLADMLWIADDATAKGYVVVWTDVLPYKTFSGAGTDPVGQATSYNALMALACAARSGNPLLRCVFSYAQFEDPGNPGALNPTYSCDGIHHTAAGAALMAARSLSAIQAP
jgi:lysophospholipase L1-like esterase